MTVEPIASRELEIINRKGLHARATAKFVHCVEAYDAEVRVTRLARRLAASRSWASSRSVPRRAPPSW